MRPAFEVLRDAQDAWFGLAWEQPDINRAIRVIEADRVEREAAAHAKAVAEIVAWLNVRAGQVLQLHSEAKTDHERNIVDEHASALEQSAIEIEAKFGGRDG